MDKTKRLNYRLIFVGVFLCLVFVVQSQQKGIPLIQPLDSVEEGTEADGALAEQISWEWGPLINQLDTTEVDTEKYGGLLVDICWQICEMSPDSAIYYCDLAKEYASKAGNDSVMIRAILGFSVIDSYQGKHAEAIEKSFKALRLAEETNDTLSMADAVNNIGIDLYYQGEFTEALKYYRLFAEYSDKIGNLKQYANALNNMAMIESELGNSQKEIELYQQAIQIFEEIKDQVGMANSSINLGVAYADAGDYKRAIEKYEKSYEYFKEQGFSSALGELLTFWAASLNQLGKQKEAIGKIREGLSVSRATNNVLQEMFAYELLHKIFYDIKQSDSAYRYQAKYLALFSEEQESSKQEVIQELKVAYETEKKEQQIDQLEQKNKLIALEASEQRQFQIILLLVALLLLLAVAFIYNRYRLKNKTNRELQALNFTKDRLFSIISHDLKSPLSSFHTITKSLTDNWGQLEKEELKGYIESLRDSSKEVHTMMDNLLRWALSQTGQLDFKPQELKVQDIVQQVEGEFSSALKASSLSFQNEMNATASITADQDFLKIILRNLISNAIKFSKMNTSIHVRLEATQTGKIISIHDEGIGMTSEHLTKLFNEKASVHEIDNSSKKGTGIGLTLCKELMQKMGGDIQVESEFKKGSTFKLIFPNAA